MAGAQLIRCLACGTTDRAPLSFIAVPPTENADPGSTVPLCAAERVVTRRKSSGSCPGAGNWLVKSLRFERPKYEHCWSVYSRRILVNSPACFGLFNDETRSYRGDSDYGKSTRR